MQTAAKQIKSPTHHASLNDGAVTFHADDYETVVDELVRKHGPGVPTIIELDAKDAANLASPSIGRGAPVLNIGGLGSIVAVPKPALKTGQYDAEGDKRSQRDREAAIAAGFSPKQPVYRQGLRAEGMRKFRDKFEAMPEARNACTRLINRVESEDRQDRVFAARDVRVNNAGLLALGRARLLFTGRAFSSLVSRLGMPAGAATYLPAIEPELRTVNMNQWVAGPFVVDEELRAKEAQAKKTTFEPTELVFRTRLTMIDPSEDEPARRECYGVVSGS